jgi:hypothetical protein
MERYLMSSPTQLKSLDEADEGIHMAQYSQQQQMQSDIDDDEGTIDMAEYAQSHEAEETSWWDAAKEAGVQAASGLGQAFTYPLDILKMAMIGEGLSVTDELEDAFVKAGKPFDKNKYIQTVMQQGEFIPTQELLERTIDNKFGTNIGNPKTKTGKFFNKLFFLGGITKGKGLTKAGVKKGAKAGLAGATTTAVLREAGAPEIVSELAGDVAGGVASLEKSARKFTAEQQNIIDIADKYGLPLMELMIEDVPKGSPKISRRRKRAFEKELGMSTNEAINEIVEGKIPISKLRGQGKDLEVLEDEAYEKATTLARANPNKLKTTGLLADIDREIARIKSLAPSPSDAQKSAIKILEGEKTSLTLAKGGSTTEQLINQTKNYNSNVKSIYRKAEYSGVEDEVKNAYAFLNDRIRNTIEQQSVMPVIEAHRAANIIHGQNASLARTEGHLLKAFPNGEFNAKKLNQVLNNKGSGAQLRKDIGDDGVRQLREIAEYGDRAQKATTQYTNSAKHKFKIGDWGPLAGFLLSKAPAVTATAVVVKPMWDYVRGWALTRPVAREVYGNILRNAAKGSFENMAKDFATLDKEISNEFGSLDDFMKQGIQDLNMYIPGEEDED